MNTETLALLIQDHARFPGALLNLFQGSPLEVLRARESEGRWSPLEILAHLRDEEQMDFRVRAKACIDGREFELNVDPERWVTEKRYNEMDPGAVFMDFAAERADSCRWLATLSVADLAAPAKNEKWKGMRAGDFIAAWRVHDLLHLRQFAQAMAVIHVQRYDGWNVGYAGTIPAAAKR
jgi:hypothetical protein